MKRTTKTLFLLNRAMKSNQVIIIIMEKEGLSRAPQFLLDHQLTVATLITDRHKQISKFIFIKHPDIAHHYDVWHVSKGAWSPVQLHNGNSLTQN